MYFTKKNLLALVSLATKISAATTCDPIEQDNCPADPALATGFAENFHSESKWFKNLVDPEEITYSETDGLAMTLRKRGQAPTIESNFYIMFGKIEVELKAANGTGIVSSVVLLSDDKDEIDIELLGGDKTQFQTNYFSKGNTTTYNRGQFESVYAPQDVFHNYTIDWAVDRTTWYLDGNPVRVLENTTSQGYPQTPMVLKMGIWAGGDPSNAPGTIEWAGGITDYNDAPFTMYVKRVIVTDYSTGKEYSYSNKSGSWESIVAEDGEINGRYNEALQEFDELANGNDGSNASNSSNSIATTENTTSQTENSSSTDSSSSNVSNFSSTTIASLSVSNTISSTNNSSTTLSVSSSFTSTSTGFITSTLGRNSTSTGSNSLSTTKTDSKKDASSTSTNNTSTISDDKDDKDNKNKDSVKNSHEIAQTENRAATRRSVPFNPVIYCLITLLNFI